MIETFKLIQDFHNPETVCPLFKLNESAGVYVTSRVTKNWNNLPRD